jgi:hypothetical protein
MNQPRIQSSGYQNISFIQPTLRFCCINETRLLEWLQFYYINQRRLFKCSCQISWLNFFLCFVMRRCRNYTERNMTIKNLLCILLLVKASREHFCLRTHELLHLSVSLSVRNLRLFCDDFSVESETVTRIFDNNHCVSGTELSCFCPLALHFILLVCLLMLRSVVTILLVTVTGHTNAHNALTFRQYLFCN